MESRHLRFLEKLTKHPLSGKCCGEDFLPMECGLNTDVLESSHVDLDGFGESKRPFFKVYFQCLIEHLTEVKLVLFMALRLFLL